MCFLHINQNILINVRLPYESFLHEILCQIILQLEKSQIYPKVQRKKMRPYAPILQFRLSELYIARSFKKSSYTPIYFFLKSIYPSGALDQAPGEYESIQTKLKAVGTGTFALSHLPLSQILLSLFGILMFLYAKTSFISNSFLTFVYFTSSGSYFADS